MGRKHSDIRVWRKDSSAKQSMSLPTPTLQPREIIWQMVHRPVGDVAHISNWKLRWREVGARATMTYWRGYRHRWPRGAGNTLVGRGPKTCRILKFVWSSFGLDSTLLTEGSILRVLGVTSLIITEGSPIIEMREGEGPVVCVTYRCFTKIYEIGKFFTCLHHPVGSLIWIQSTPL